MQEGTNAYGESGGVGRKLGALKWHHRTNLQER